jgi:uncharacterized coiled-coil protein SlyX
MSQPRPESRLSELESKMAIQDARIRELSDDTAESLRDLKQDIKQLGEGITASFLQIGDALGATWARLDKIEATMATKDDIAELKGLIKQLMQQKSGD